MYAYVGKIWHATVSQWSMLTVKCRMNRYTVSLMRGKKRRNITISTKFSHVGASYARPPLPIRAKFGKK